ncbi:MAG: hypothetical protein K2L82_06500 [Lachnospiraceae bacterium]|nr:hypothetical protein [Lachnospiraceae bacterium]
MTIGALGAYGFQPYVYNTNAVSAASMNKLSKISDDVLDKKVDYSELTDESKNVNPLKKGQTLNFQSMLQMQMQRGQNNAARIMKPTEKTQETENDTQVSETEQASEAVIAQFDQKAAQIGEEAASQNEVSTNADANGSNNINYQMQQALNAYGMFMTA